MPLHIGLIINPLAGLGGSRALKGSDGSEMREIAAHLRSEELHRSQDRAGRALAYISGRDDIVVSTWSGDMGGDVCRALDMHPHLLGDSGPGLSGPEDTREAARTLLQAGVDLLVFAGGDGTARDIYDVVGGDVPVLGIPAGVKMHSGVFAVSPEAAGELLLALARGGLVGLRAQEVRDIDEEAFRNDVVKARYYGELQVPGEGRYLQHTKVGGRESQELVAAEIAAWVAENMQAGVTYFIGPGSTTAAIMEELGLDNTLLGVDAVRDGQLLGSDLDEAGLLAILDAAPATSMIIVTVIGGQGHLFGRGNQQFTPAVIRRVGVDRICVVAAKSKIAELEGRPLLVDSNDPDLDDEFSGYREIITGYDDRILYPVGIPEEQGVRP